MESYKKYRVAHGTIWVLGIFAILLILVVCQLAHILSLDAVVLAYFVLVVIGMGLFMFISRREDKSGVRYLEALSERMMMRGESELADCLDSFIEKYFG